MNQKINCLLSVLMMIFVFAAIADAEIYTTADGYQVEIKLIPDKSEIMLDEPMWFSLEIKNLSDVDMAFIQGGDYRNEFGRPDSFSIEAKDEFGTLAKKVESKFNMGGLSGFTKIPVGEKKEIRFLTSHWINFERTGFYTIFCQKEMVIKKYDSANMMDSFKAPATTIDVKNKITVIPKNLEQTGKVIETFGRDLFGDSPEKSIEALKALTFINDERVIKYFVKVIGLVSEGNKKYYDYRFYVFRPLAKFNDKNAFEAIVKDINSPNNEIRREVAISLSNSLYPQAEKFLLSMRNDKFDAVRLDVVHYLGKTKTSKSTAILKTMLNDNFEWVRKEAKRYLEEREEKVGQ